MVLPQNVQNRSQPSRKNKKKYSCYATKQCTPLLSSRKKQSYILSFLRKNNFIHVIYNSIVLSESS